MAAKSKEQQKFAKWVLNVGDGSLLTTCNITTPRFVAHRFWQCLRVHKTWELAFTFLCNLRYPYHNLKNSKTLSIKQCNLFNNMNFFHNEFFPFVSTNIIIIMIKAIRM
jgi:hypothetical protein